MVEIDNMTRDDPVMNRSTGKQFSRLDPEEEKCHPLKPRTYKSNAEHISMNTIDSSFDEIIRNITASHKLDARVEDIHEFGLLRDTEESKAQRDPSSPRDVRTPLPDCGTDQKDLLLSVDPKPEKHEIRQKKKSVRFFDNNEIFMIPHVQEFSIEMKSSLWYSRSEMSSLEEEILQTLELMRNNEEPFVEEKFNVSFRGLESMVSEEEEILREESIYHVVYQVLDEQDRQRAECVDDHEQLASVCAKHSEWSKHMARVRAQIDETCVLIEKNSHIQNVTDSEKNKIKECIAGDGINRHNFNPRRQTITLTFR